MKVVVSFYTRKNLDSQMLAVHLPTVAHEKKVAANFLFIVLPFSIPISTEYKFI